MRINNITPNYYNTESHRVSCIVPAYNAVNTLSGCIYGLVNQTYQNLEIIIVDDGSKDGTGMLCDEYAEQYANVRVIHQGNSGVSIARNAGLKQATGDRIFFVDADDEVLPTYVEKLIAEDADWVLGGYQNGAHRIELKNERYNHSEIPRFFLSHFHRLYTTVPWGKLYRTSIIKDQELKFDPRIRLGEDLVFNLNYLLYCNSIALIPSVGYRYIQEGVGAEKYHLHAEEIAYTIRQVDSSADMLRKKYGGASFCCRDIKRTLIGTYPLTRILDGDSEYETLYLKTFPDKDKKYLWNDVLCSPYLRGKRYIKYYIKSYRIAAALHMMRKLLFACCKYYV